MTSEHLRIGAIEAKYNAIVRQARAARRARMALRFAEVAFWAVTAVVVVGLWVSIAGAP